MDPKENKNYKNFVDRLLVHFDLLNKINCNYSKTIYSTQYTLYSDTQNNLFLKLNNIFSDTILYDTPKVWKMMAHIII